MAISALRQTRSHWELNLNFEWGPIYLDNAMFYQNKQKKKQTSTIPDDAIHLVIMNVKVTQYTSQIIAVSLSKDFHENVFSRMRTKGGLLTCQIIAKSRNHFSR